MQQVHHTTKAYLFFASVVVTFVFLFSVFTAQAHEEDHFQSDDIDDIRAHLLATDPLAIGAAWFNGTYQNDTIWDYSTNYSAPNYGTHDWIADHAKNLLPSYEREYIDRNYNAFLLGTEAPDNAALNFYGPGYGDFQNHINYYTADFQHGLTTPAATRSAEEYGKADSALPENELGGAYYAGTLSHYIADPAVFGHVMGDGSPLGVEHNHANYERGTNAWTLSYNGGFFEKYIAAFSPNDTLANAHSASYYVGLDTARGTGVTKSAQWMDANYPGDANSWNVNSNATFTDSVGDSLNRAVQAIAAVYHDMALKNGYSLERIAGSNRYHTAIAASQKAYPSAGSAGGVILARGDDFPDALAAASLAGKINAPILLTRTDSIDSDTKTEIARVLGDGSKKIFIIGGTASISNAAVNDLAASLPYARVRIAGDDRIGTAVEIASRINNADRAFVVNAYQWPDSVSISAIAAQGVDPILPTANNQLDSRWIQYLSTEPTINTVYVVGGTSMISNAVVAQLQALGVTVQRIAGSNRYETNRLVIQQFNSDYSKVTLATGEQFIDGLAGSVLAAKANAPLVLVSTTNNSALNTTTYPFLESRRAQLSGGYVLGGEAMIPRLQQMYLGQRLY